MSKTVWVLVGAVIGVLAMLVLASLSGYWGGAPAYGPGWGMMGPGMMGGFGFPFMGGIVMLLFWVLLIGGIVWLAQSLARGTPAVGTNASARDMPLDILKRRYAQGEITADQFAQMKRDLDQ